MGDGGTSALGRVLATVVGVPAFIGLLALALLSGGISAWSFIAWLGLGLVVAGLAMPRGPAPTAAGTGLALIASVVVARTFVAREGAGRGEVVLSVVTVKPAAVKPRSRLATRWVDEASVVLPAARLLAPAVAHARMRDDYAALREDEGEAPVVERTLSLATRPVFLVGLSDGAEGASRLAPTLGDAALAGLVLVSGADPEAAPPPVRTLLLAGEDDLGGEVTYAERHALPVTRLPGGHFVMLESADALDGALRAFLRDGTGELTAPHK